MDPQQKWKNLLDSWARSQWKEVISLADSLTAGLGDGGHPPDLEHPRVLGADFNTAAVRAACEFASRRATSVLDNPRLIPQDVPFTLTCQHCNNDGPDAEDQARSQGWTDISYVPAALSENFLGICPICRAEEV